MRRVASAELVTMTSSMLPSRMNVVGSTAEALTVMTLRPVAGIV